MGAFWEGGNLGEGGDHDHAQEELRKEGSKQTEPWRATQIETFLPFDSL